MSADPLEPLRSLDQKQREALLALVYIATTTAVVGTRCFDALVGLQRPADAIVRGVMECVTTLLDETP